jgi:DNA-directed RNA polymerase beta' subunit
MGAGSSRQRAFRHAPRALDGDTRTPAAVAGAPRSLRPMGIMVNSGSTRADAAHPTAGGFARLMADPSGRFIDLPIQSNFRVGLTSLEYFISPTAHARVWPIRRSARRRRYLTARLVYVAHYVIIQSEDCGPPRGSSSQCRGQAPRREASDTLWALPGDAGGAPQDCEVLCDTAP